MGHARYSPSSAFRRLHCPPSLVLEESFDDETSAYVAEGTAGHALAEHLIKRYLKQQTKRPVSDYYTDELVDTVNDYVEFVIGQIEEARRTCKDPVFSVEQRVDASEYVEGCYGTADMVIITDEMVHIIDLKLGKGVAVDATENSQLMIYGLGMLQKAELLYDPHIVRLSIYQPRIYNYSTWDTTPDALKKWGNEVLRPNGAMALIGAGEYAAGSWCRFCKARFKCRARAEEFLSLAQMEFRQPALLEDAEIAEVLRKADDLAKWASEIYSYAQDEAIVHGKQWPGFKVVEGKSNRKYTSDEEVAAAAEAAGYKDIYKKSLIGIGDMERLMGKATFKEVLGHLVYKPQGKLTLVPISDKRPAITKTTASAEFQEE